MLDWATILMSALDEVEFDIVVLDSGLQTRFINHAFYRTWALPVLPPGASYNFGDIVHGRQTGAYIFAPGSVADYVRQRKGRLRLSDGRILKFQCRAFAGRRPHDDLHGHLGPRSHRRPVARTL